MREELQQVYKKLKNYVDRKVEEIPVSAGGGSATPIIFTTNDFATAVCNKTFAECVQDYNNNNFSVFVKLIDATSVTVTNSIGLEYSESFGHFITTTSLNGVTVQAKIFRDDTVAFEMIIPE